MINLAIFRQSLLQVSRRIIQRNDKDDFVGVSLVICHLKFNLRKIFYSAQPVLQRLLEVGESIVAGVFVVVFD